MDRLHRQRRISYPLPIIYIPKFRSPSRRAHGILLPPDPVFLHAQSETSGVLGGWQ